MTPRRLVLVTTVLLVACAAPAQEPRAPTTPVSSPAKAPPAPNVTESVGAPPPPLGGSGVTPTPTPGTSTTGGEAKPTTTAVPPTTTSQPTNPQPPTPVDDVPHAQAKFEESAQIFTAAGTDCSKMCKALASMERAAGHLCDLVKTGVAADKKKCTDAKARVDHARDRVMSTCGGCDG
jgi:hypothetical protein